MSDLVVVDYQMGNLGSVLNMVRKIGGKAVVSSDKGIIENAKKLILPGVGRFDQAMKNLKDLNLIPVLNYKAKQEKVPILGICLGMQLLSDFSEEGEVNGLGWIPAKTIKFNMPSGSSLKVPHMGWNEVYEKQNHC